MIRGHGHVTPRPDGMVAKCGGPAICRECALELARKLRENAPPEKAPPLTPTMLKALKALHENGGSGVVTRTGTVLAGGEELNDDDPDNGRFGSRTWLRLFAAGMIEAKGGGRIGVSAEGMKLVALPLSSVKRRSAR